MNEPRVFKLMLLTIRRYAWLRLASLAICLALPPHILLGAPPSEAEVKRGAALEQRLREANAFIASADSAAIAARLAELCASLPVVKWEAVYGGVPAEPSALRSSWFKNAQAYPIESGLAASNADAFVGYLSAREMFSVLIEKDTLAAMRVLERSASEQPALLHAMFCGILLQSSQTPDKAVGLRRQLDDGQMRSTWSKLLEAKNPIIRALSLELMPSDIATSPAMTETLRDALRSEWISLHYIAFDAAVTHRPPNVAAIIDLYLAGLPARPESAVLKESLRAKALHTKAALSTPRPDGGS